MNLHNIIINYYYSIGVNTPNANANCISGIFRIETVHNPDGNIFLQFQYT